LAPLLKNKATDFPSRTLFVHHQGRFGAPVGQGALIRDKDYAVMTEKWRMVCGELYDFQNDKSQRSDIASQHPEVVQRLKTAYDTWWNDVEVADEKYDPFIIDPAKQRSVTISAQNLLGGHVAYNQQHVRSGMLLEDSFAVIDVAKAGKYKITLRRWPRELDKAIDASVPKPVLDPKTHNPGQRLYNLPSKALNVTSARLKVGDFDETVPVKSGDKEVVFEVDLKKGEQKIETWFKLADGNSTAAYYQYIDPIRLAESR
jgi:hypothetical protein